MLVRYKEYETYKQETITDKWNGLSKRKRYIITQKLLGVGLILIGIAAMMMFPEDAYGGFVASGMGLLRVVFNDWVVI